MDVRTSEMEALAVGSIEFEIVESAESLRESVIVDEIDPEDDTMTETDFDDLFVKDTLSVISCVKLLEVEQIIEDENVGMWLVVARKVLEGERVCEK